jgi:hypothetical protein
MMYWAMMFHANAHMDNYETNAFSREHSNVSKQHMVE